MKILVIGLDAATMDVIKPWSAAGELPTLARLMREGAHSTLLSTPNMHSASAWTSILTGLNPGRHGLYVFSDRDWASGEQLFFKGGDRRGELLTRHLARQGWTTGMLNVPMTYPAEGQAGSYMVSGLDAPALGARAFYPADLRDELLARFPDYAYAPKGLGDLMRAGRVAEAVAAWLRLIEVQTQAAEHLIEKHPTDFFMCVYTASDWGGHNLWKYFDPAHAEFVEGSPHRDALLSIYRALDGAVARLLKFAEVETQVYVISDHGMGVHSGASYHLAKWLESRGYLVKAKQAADRRAALLKASRNLAKRVLPGALKERLKAGLGEERLKRLQTAEKDAFYSSIDWSQTTAYTEAGRHVVNLNLAGRNRQGIVAIEEYQKVCDALIAALLDWKDGRGVAVVERVARRDEVYKGEYASRASDLYIYWNRAAQLGEPPREVKAKGFWWSGDHRPEGILICQGRGIRKAGVAEAPTVYDLAPTMLHLAGLAVPEGLDGRVMAELLTPEHGADVRFEAANQRGLTAADAGLSEEEERLIEEKLRALGYL